MNWNINFCSKKEDFDYCQNNCNKTCPTVSNFWYGHIINPLINLWMTIQNRFTKCDKLPTKCSFLFCKKYCSLHRRCK